MRGVRKNGQKGKIMQKFLRSNETRYRLARTILQGIIGVLIANVDLLVAGLTIPTAYKPMIVALVMAILSPIMSELGNTPNLEEQDVFNADEFLEMIEYEDEYYEDTDDPAEE